MFKKEFFSGLLLVLGVFLLGGLGGVYMNNYVVPRFVALPWIAEKAWFDGAAQQITVIEKTEEVTVREDDALDKVFAQPATAVVTLVYPARTTGAVNLGEFSAPGFFVTNDGVIATYSADGSSLPTPRVILNDGQKYELAILGVDSYTNLVFYKITKSVNTPTVQFANSDDTRVGKKILLLKNTEVANESQIDLAVMAGHEYSFNLAGGLAYSEKWEGVWSLHSAAGKDFIGGPAVSYNSEVVGMVASLYDEETKKDTFFILPSNVIRTSLSKVIEEKLLTQAFLGTHYISLNPLSASQTSLALEEGALITEITSHNTTYGERFLAKKMGLKKGDIVTSVNGTKITPKNSLSSLIYPLQKGDELTLIVVRQGQEKELKGIFE
jgi:S1-C subfamily serine protease